MKGEREEEKGRQKDANYMPLEKTPSYLGTDLALQGLVRIVLPLRPPIRVGREEASLEQESGESGARIVHCL